MSFRASSTAIAMGAGTLCGVLGAWLVGGAQGGQTTPVAEPRAAPLTASLASPTPVGDALTDAANPPGAVTTLDGATPLALASRDEPDGATPLALASTDELDGSTPLALTSRDELDGSTPLALASRDELDGSVPPSPSDSAGVTTAGRDPLAALWEALSVTVPATPTAANTQDIACRGLDDLACLGLAQAYDRGGPLGWDPPKADSYYRLAYARLVPKCNRRFADACATIAKMHHDGRGLPKDQRAEAALIERARRLCGQGQQGLCPHLVTR